MYEFYIKTNIYKSYNFKLFQGEVSEILFWSGRMNSEDRAVKEKEMKELACRHMEKRIAFIKDEVSGTEIRGVFRKTCRL